MRVTNAAICTDVEKTDTQLNLNGVFSELVKDPIPASVKCCLVVGLAKETDDQPGFPVRLAVEIIHKESAASIRAGEGTTTIPELTSALILRFDGGLPLNGEGTYCVRLINITDADRPNPLRMAIPVLAVKSRVSCAQVA